MLVKPAILNELEKPGGLSITDQKGRSINTEEQVGRDSIDLRIGNRLGIVKNDSLTYAEDLNKRTGDLEDICDELRGAGTDHPMFIQEGESVLAYTEETVNLPIYLGATLSGRSTPARHALKIHNTACFVHVGFNGRLMLEMSSSNGQLQLYQFMPVCQIRLEYANGVTDDLDSYDGASNGQ